MGILKKLITIQWSFKTGNMERFNIQMSMMSLGFTHKMISSWLIAIPILLTQVHFRLLVPREEVITHLLNRTTMDSLEEHNTWGSKLKMMMKNCLLLIWARIMVSLLILKVRQIHFKLVNLMEQSTNHSPTTPPYDRLPGAHKLLSWIIWPLPSNHLWEATVSCSIKILSRLLLLRTIWTLEEMKYLLQWVKIPTLWATDRSITITSMMWDLKISSMKTKSKRIIRADLNSKKMSMMCQQAPIIPLIPKTTVRCLQRHLQEDKRCNSEIIHRAISPQLKVPQTDKLWLISLLIRHISTKRLPM